MFKKTRGNYRPAKPENYLIGEVSQFVNLSQKTIREYEKIGLIKPQREPRTNNRLYSDFEVEQIRHITYLIHEEGFTLPCIKRILELAPCWNIFNCEVKEQCSAYLFAPQPCYKIRKDRETLCAGTCTECAVFLNRSRTILRILRGPNAEHYQIK